MKKYNLSDFGLNKQSLKRKLNEVTNPSWKEKMEKLLNVRTTLYSLDEIETIVKGFYSGIGVLEQTDSEQPLSIYYKKQNKEKYQKLKTLIQVKKTGSIETSLRKDINSLVNNSMDNIMQMEDFNEKLKELTTKYGVTMKKVTEIANGIEEEWLNKILD